jgi:hypothetical protein
MCLDVRRIDHLRSGRSTALGKFTEEMLPDTLFGPPGEAFVDGRVRTILRWAIFQRQPLRSACRMPLMTRRSSARSLTPDIGRQVRFDPLPLVVVEPE